MEQIEIKKIARVLYSDNKYCSALSMALSLDEKTIVNFLVKDDSNDLWLQNPEFCNQISQNEELILRLVNLKRADELLFKHFNTNWEEKDVNNILPFQIGISKFAPLLFVKLMRVSQAFIKSKWQKEYINISLPVNLSVHQIVWKHLQDEEAILWHDVEKTMCDFISSGLDFSEILTEIVIALEFEYSDSKNNNNVQHLRDLYNVFIPLLFSKLPKQLEINYPSNDDMSSCFEEYLKSNKVLSKEVNKLFKKIDKWLNFNNVNIDPYSFDLEITPVEEFGLVSYNRTSKAYYKWELDGVRYDINRRDYLFDAEETFNKQLNNGTLKFPENVTKADIDYEKKCQLQSSSLYYFMKDLNLSQYPNSNNLNSERFYQPLIAASNMFEAIFDGQLYCDVYSSKNWYAAYRRMYKRMPTHLGLRNLPFLFLNPAELYSIHDTQSKIERDTKTKCTTLCNPFCFKPQFGMQINRFNLNYDVFKKPFLKLDNNIFCPILFFAKNDWFYPVVQNALELLDKDVKLRKNTADKMEMSLSNLFKDLGFKSEIFADNKFNNIEGDVDIKVTDGKDTILIQLKRTKLRLNLKDAYFEKVNTDRKASRQINNVENIFDIKGETIHKWIVTNSYENIYTEIDGCLKVNYIDLLTCLKSSKYIGRLTLNDLITNVISDSQIRDVIIGQEILEPSKMSLLSLFKYQDPKEYSLLRKYKDQFEVYRSVNLPLPISDPKMYRDTRFSVDKVNSDFIQKYNNALDADRRGDLYLAHKLFSDCIIEKPNDFDSISALANVLANMKRYDEAYESFEKALSLNSNDFFVMRNYAIALLENNKMDRFKSVAENINKDYWFVDSKLFKSAGEIPKEVLQHF